MADIDSLTVDYAECPLHWLVGADRYFSQIQARLEDPNLRDVNCNDLLLAAAMTPKNNRGIVKLLICWGADVNSLNANKNTPLHLAVCSRNAANFNILIEYGAYVNARDLKGRTPLHFAVCQSTSEHVSPFSISYCYIFIVVKLLRHPGINVNLADSTGDTPLMWAVKELNVKAVKALLTKGADPNLPNRFKSTPLHEIFYPSRLPPLVREPIALELLEKGAGIYCGNKFQQTPIDILLCIVYNESNLMLAARCLKKIALRFNVRNDLKSRLKQKPYLHNHFNACCGEVALMKLLVIGGHGNLHDFALGCFPTKHENLVEEVYRPVVELLIVFKFSIYQKLILNQFSRSGLGEVLNISLDKPHDFKLQRHDTRSYLYGSIYHAYKTIPKLKLRLEGLKMSLGFDLLYILKHHNL